ncbi:Hypothetical protein, putative [Bodo saltans]|uniref:Membrane-associated protein n=1 Tax=Bodo saltans TaxID=75058 RepID=A0A0S4JRB1_BODSA|nr:Hypothetical protein, putative [Bodo saltans]|eukprot:CUG92792.1 Hypothetical protein, putative [Bodo saltans]
MLRTWLFAALALVTLMERATPFVAAIPVDTIVIRAERSSNSEVEDDIIPTLKLFHIHTTTCGAVVPTTTAMDEDSASQDSSVRRQPVIIMHTLSDEAAIDEHDYSSAACYVSASSISPQLVEPNSGKHVRVQEELEASFRISCIALPIDDNHDVASMGCSAAVQHREPITLAVIDVQGHLPTNTHDNNHPLHGVNLSNTYRRSARRVLSSHAIQQRYEEHQNHPENANDICAVTVITNAQGVSMDHTM